MQLRKGRLLRAITASLLFTYILASFTDLVPRNCYLVSLMLPVILSMTDLTRTPLLNPTCRQYESDSPLFMKQIESGIAGRACKLMRYKQLSESSPKILKVLSPKPTARYLLRVRPSGTSPTSRHFTSVSRFFFKHSRRFPDISSISKYTSQPPSMYRITWRELEHAIKILLSDSHFVRFLSGVI